MIRVRVKHAIFLAALLVLLVPAAAAAAPFLYVAGDGGTWGYDASGGALSAGQNESVASSGGSSAIAISPDGRSAYIELGFGAGIGQYDIGSDGSLAPKSAGVAPNSANACCGIAVSPDGESVYAIVQGHVIAYNVGSDGALTEKGTNASIATGTGPADLAITPDGKYVYVTNYNDETISQYVVNADGTLSANNPATATVPRGYSSVSASPEGLAITPDGKSLYVAEYYQESFGAVVAQFGINSDGTLSSKTPNTVAAGSLAKFVAVSPDGKNAYVTDTQDGTLSQYAIDGTTGNLTALTPAAVSTGSGSNSRPEDVVVSPDGGTVYNSNGGDTTISQFARAADGTLTAMTTPTVSAPALPWRLAMSPPPPPPPHTTSTTVSCVPTSIQVGSSTSCTATVTDTIASPTPPSGTIGFSSDGNGSFSVTSCALAGGSGATSSCSVTYTPSATGSGSHTITGSYGGDPSHSGSSNAAHVTVSSLPPVHHTLTATLAGSGSGAVSGSGISCPGACASSYPAGTQVTLTATPSSSSTFAGWSGGGCSGSGACSVTVNADTTVTATFNATTTTPPPSAPPSASVSKVKVTGTSLALTITCSASSGTACNVLELLTTAEHVKGSTVFAVSSNAKQRKMRVTLANASVTVVPGTSKTVTLALNSKGLAVLTRFHTLPARLTVTLVNAATPTVIASRTVTFKRAKHKQRALWRGPA